MRFCQIVAIALFSAFVAGCSSTLSNLNGEDISLPKVNNIKTIADVSSVGFEWDAINDPRVRGFLVYRNDGSGFKEIAHLKNNFTSHFVDEKLLPERTYSYYFHTLGEGRYSPKSEIVSIKTSFINPVESVFATNDYPKKVKIIWSPHPNPSISHYLVQRQERGDFKTIAIVNNRLLVEYFDENLKDESNYSYRIVAVDFMGNPSRPSKIVTARTREKPKISTNISATNNLPNSIIISWEAVNDALTYKIYRSKSLNANFKHISTTNESRFVDKPIEPNTSYFYKVSSVDGADIESNLSVATQGRTRAFPKTPKIIKGYVDKQESKIEWAENPNVRYFVVHRRDGALFGNTMKFKVYGTSFNDKDMKIGKEYTYYVVSVDDVGLESAPSETVVLSIK